MTRKKTSPIWLLNKNEMQELLDGSESFVEVLNKLKLNAHSGNHRTLNQRIKKDSLDVEKLQKRRKEKIRQASIRKKIPISEILVENSNYSTNHLKARLINEKILDYHCERCNNTGYWNNEKLVLQLEHKNGNSKDNRLENLCFLCPNCHSQTDTYAGKNSSVKKSKVCSICKVKTKGKGTLCRSCASKSHPKKFYVTKEDLEILVKKHPLTVIGKKFNVTDNSIRKRCISFGIELPKRK